MSIVFTEMILCSSILCSILQRRIIIPLHKIKTSTNCGLTFPLFSTSVKALKDSRGNIKREKMKINSYEEISRTNATKNLHVELPEKPKKPQSPYFLFLAHKRQELAKSDTKISVVDFVKQCAIEWEDLDESQKKKFQDKYKLSLKEYMFNLVEYKKNLTDEQKESLENISEEIKRRRLLREKRKVSINYRYSPSILSLPYSTSFSHHHIQFETE